MGGKFSLRIAPLKKIVMFVLVLIPVVVLVLWVAVSIFVWRAMAIDRYPSCVGYQSEGDARLGSALSKSIGSYLTARGFESSSRNQEEFKWESPSTLVLFGNGSRLWLNICTKNEALPDWLVVARGIQELKVSPRWSPAAWLVLNPDVTGCRSDNALDLDYPVDFERIERSFERLKATCKSAQARIK